MDNFEDLKEEASRLIEHVKSHSLGDNMPCPQCGTAVPIRRNRQHTEWDAECRCGWSVAGSGPPVKRN